MMKDKYSYYMNRCRNQQYIQMRLHREDCAFIKDIESKTFLGDFCSHQEALKQAQKIYPNIRPCTDCSWDD